MKISLIIYTPYTFHQINIDSRTYKDLWLQI